PAIFPSLDRCGVIMAEGFGETGDPAEKSYDAFCGSAEHTQVIRYLRSSVNVENVSNLRRNSRMVESRNEHVTQKLRGLRKRTPLSMKALARLLDYADASSYQRYEDETEFKKPYLPRELV